MHDWEDNTVDWKGIWAAADFLQSYCRRWGRIFCHGKEKYGTIRLSVSMGWESLHGLVYPGYGYSQFPQWLWTLDCLYIAPVIRRLFGPLIRRWQVFIYRRAYRLALKQWPHLRKEILTCADGRELLEGL